MTEDEIVAAYLTREAAAKKTPQGQDVRAICDEVGELAGIPADDVLSLVIEATILGVC